MNIPSISKLGPAVPLCQGQAPTGIRRRPLHHAALLLSGLLLAGMPALSPAQVTVGIGVALPGVHIGINVPSYPQLVQVPDYPVYYAPGMQSNYFFYDGVYWVYRNDQWYASDWYNGPWNRIAPAVVPLYVLRVPVRYYRSPPRHFAGWSRDAPPRWGDHWGNEWQQRHRGWEQWDHRSAPRPAPLPAYQRQYSADRYPPPERQRELRSQNYQHQSREAYIPRHDQQRAPPVSYVPSVGHAPPPPHAAAPPYKPREKDGERGDDKDRDDGKGKGNGQGNGKGKGNNSKGD